MTAYTEGLEAARRGKTGIDNPYIPVTLAHLDWEHGRSDQVAWYEHQQGIRVIPHLGKVKP